MIGYTHASPKGQNLKQQRAVLGAAGCAQIFEEDDPTAQPDRPELTRMLEHLRAGDVVTVTRLDRLARSRRDLLAIAVRINEANAGLRSLAEIWADTTTPDGSELLTVLAGIVDFERGLIAETHKRRQDRGQSAGHKVRSRPDPVGRADRARAPTHR
ncbi:recombinase family protein [Rhizobium rhizosphaerae]|uniref:recombinase family protein n=1 Tax=Xaviernesmea rhizosphaerae TaxID=1672749 RepID=UPI001FD9DBA6|nr:recombinase family protein [Xaviernesmea rhizosphaerae]